MFGCINLKHTQIASVSQQTPRKQSIDSLSEGVGGDGDGNVTIANNIINGKDTPHGAVGADVIGQDRDFEE